METPSPINKKFTKEEFHNELVDYLQYCPTEERKAVMKFLKILYSINIHTLFTGDVIDLLTDNIDITNDDIDNVSLVNFLMTSQTRIRHKFSDMDNIMDNHILILAKMVSSVWSTKVTSKYDTVMLKYIMLLRIYLDLKLINTIREHDRDNRV